MKTEKRFKLNLGCGPKWKEQYPDHVGLDIVNYGQDYVGDVLEILPNLSDGTLKEVIANHFLEHFDQDQLVVIFSQVNRILEEGGFFKFVVPHKCKPKAWDLRHKTFWNRNTVELILTFKELGSWELVEVVVNSRKDIHAWLRKAGK